MNILILGAPGSGKGTQSDFLINKFNLTHLSTGDLFQEEVKKETPLGLRAKSYMDQGLYVPTEITNSIIESKIKETEDSLILDGYPRTLEQVNFLETALNSVNKKIDLVIYLDIDEAAVTERLLSRLICSDCKTTYNTLSLPPKAENTCDKDNGVLVQRTDDSDIAKVTTRIKEYNTSTQPLIDYFKNKVF